MINKNLILDVIFANQINKLNNLQIRFYGISYETIFKFIEKYSNIKNRQLKNIIHYFIYTDGEVDEFKYLINLNHYDINYRLPDNNWSILDYLNCYNCEKLKSILNERTLSNSRT